VRSSGRWPHRCLARCYRIPRPPTSGSGLRLLLAPAAAISDNEPTLPSSHRAVGKTQQCSVRSFVIGNQLPGFRPTPAPPAPLPLRVLFVHPYSAAPITAHDQMGCSDAYTEIGLRVYKELAPMRKDQVDLVNAVAWIPESKTPNGVAEVPLTEIAVEAFRSQLEISGDGPWLFPCERSPLGYQQSFKKAWSATLRRAGVRYFRLYDLRSTYATRLSAGGVSDEWVTQLLRQGHSAVFKKYSQMKLQMKREALQKLNRHANELGSHSDSALAKERGSDTVLIQFPAKKTT
jgi:hypothetical protein